MTEAAFTTELLESGNLLVGPWRSPKQMLHAQVYDSHASIHDDATAQKLGFQGGTIEGPTHFSQFAPLCERIWGQAWFETGCLSAHYRNPAFEGEEVQANIEKPKPGQTICAIGMTKRDGTEILRGTASVGGDGSETALRRRLGELKPLADPVILADLKVGMKTPRQTVKMDFDQHMGDLYPFSLAQKLKVITEPSAYYSQELNPWGRAIIPMEMLSVLFQYRAREDRLPIRGPAVGLFADQEIRLLRGPLFAGEELFHRTRGGRAERQPPHRKRVGAHDRVRFRRQAGCNHAAEHGQHQGFLRQLRAGAQSALWLGEPRSAIANKDNKKMARLPYLEADQVAPEYRDMLKRNTNLHKLLVNSPDMARAFNGIGGYIRFNSKLDPRLRELAILQVGWMEKSEYEFTHHVKIGKEFGVTDDDIAALMAETEGKPSKLEPLAKAILRGAREMVRELAMSEATFAEIKQELSDEQMVDLVLTIAFYCAVVRVLATMKIDNEPYYKEVLQQYPIPGVE